MFVFVKVHATNEGDAPTSLPNPSDFQLLLDGDQYSPWSDSQQFETPVDGPGYTGTDQARSGVSETGWLAFTVPRIPTTATFSWYATDGEGAEVLWEQDLTTAMAEYPIIEFAEFLNPESPSLDEEFPIEFSIRNVGETEGTLEILVWTSGAASIEHEQTVTVPPDETITQQVPITPELPGELTIGVAPFDVTTDITVE